MHHSDTNLSLSWGHRSKWKFTLLYAVYKTGWTQSMATQLTTCFSEVCTEQITSRNCGRAPLCRGTAPPPPRQWTPAVTRKAGHTRLTAAGTGTCLHIYWVTFWASDSRAAEYGHTQVFFSDGVILRPLFGLFYQPQMIDVECGAVGGMWIGRGNRNTRRKAAPAPLCTPHIPPDLIRARTRALHTSSYGSNSWSFWYIRVRFGLDG
jgi:hypothetical protein